MGQIYRRTFVLKCEFNEVTLQLIKIALRHGCSPVNLEHIFRTPFPKNTSGGLLLFLVFSQRLTQKSLKLITIPVFILRFLLNLFFNFDLVIISFFKFLVIKTLLCRSIFIFRCACLFKTFKKAFSYSLYVLLITVSKLACKVVLKFSVSKVL